MAKHNQILDTVDECISNGVSHRILHLLAEEDQSDGRTLTIQGRQLINFASYSYLGLERDERLKQGCIDAIQKHGSQFSASRAYVSIHLYEKFEFLLSQLFGSPTLVAPTTALAHESAIPVLIRDEDAIIIDQQVHTSVQNTVRMRSSRGIPVEILRHNDVERLEERIKVLKAKYKKIWYLVD